MSRNDDYDLVPFEELKNTLLKDPEVIDALDEIQARKVLLDTLKAARKAGKLPRLKWLKKWQRKNRIFPAWKKGTMTRNWEH